MNMEKWIDEHAEIFTNLSDEIWDYAELKFDETQSAKATMDVLRDQGFTIQDGVGPVETAFIASYGSGKPVIGVLAEYDALDGMSQVAGCAEKTLRDGFTTGHGCGHNGFGAGSVAAACALKEYMIANNIQGTVRLYGCPGEEGGSGKTYMVREGAFDDVDAAIAWHPGSSNAVFSMPMLANIQVYFRFKGISSHAAGSPQNGRSALDSVEIMNVGVNYLREHVIQEARMHYAVTNTGGISPNVVQSEAEVLYLIRAPRTEQVMEIYERVCDCARGSALINGTQCEIEVDKACSNVMPNDFLCDVMSKAAMRVAPIQFNQAEYDLAQALHETLSDAAKADETMARTIKALPAELRQKAEADAENSLITVLVPFLKTSVVAAGSSDVGDVSWVTPTVQCQTACWPKATPAHSWQAVSVGRTSIMHKGLLYAAKIMAETGKDLFENPDLIEGATAELRERTGKTPYVNPIPANVMPRKYKN